MATSSSDDIWKMMSEYNFEMIDVVSSDMMCTICNKVMINACIGLCGCRYCIGCIRNYLTGENKFCPGGLNLCNRKMINIDENVNLDHSVNFRIVSSVVKCPLGPCKHQDELQNIADHLRTCKSRPVNCPYFNMGCDKNQLRSDFIKDHLEIENYGHTKLLIEYVDNLRNEIESLKGIIVELRQDNNRHKLDGERRQAAIDELQAKLDRQSRQIEQSKDRSSQSPKSIKNIEDKTENLHLKMCHMQTNLEKQNYGEFVWVIENISDKMQQAKEGITREIFSDVFYTHKNGCKMCLLVYPDGSGTDKGSHLSVYFCVMKGPFDDILSWPFKAHVTLSLMNLQSGLVHVAMTTKYEDAPNNPAYLKPTIEKNTGNGYGQFIELDQLLSNKQLVKNDKIIIKANIKLIN